MLLKKSQRQNFKVCMEKDPAVDPERSDFFSYRQRPDQAEAHIKFHEGQVPTWFELRPLDSVEYEDDALGPTRAHANTDGLIRTRFLNRKLVELALVAVHNWHERGDKIPGKKFKDWRDVPPDFIQQMGSWVSEASHGSANETDSAALMRMLEQARDRGAALEQLVTTIDAQLATHGELRRAVESNGEVTQALEVARGVLGLGPHEKYAHEEVAGDPKKS